MAGHAAVKTLGLCLAVLAIASWVAVCDTPGATVDFGSDVDAVTVSWDSEPTEGVATEISVTVYALAHLTQDYDPARRRQVLSVRVVVRFDEAPSRSVFEGAMRTRQWGTDEGWFEEGWYEAVRESGAWMASIRLIPLRSMTHLAICERGYWVESAILALRFGVAPSFAAERSATGDSPPSVADAVPECTPSEPISCRTAIQRGNETGCRKLCALRSSLLDDNRIGTMTFALRRPEYEPEIFPEGLLDEAHILNLGFKRLRLSINNLDPPKIDWSKPETTVSSEHDHFVSALVSQGISMTYNLTFWDKEDAGGAASLPSPRFQGDDELERYLDFVRRIVDHFKGRISFYEVWNEPSIPDNIQTIRATDYLRLVREAVPVIREADSRAKVVVGGTHSLIDEASHEYLFRILRSDVMPLADVVSWHPMYGSSPEHDWHREYYDDYPNIVRSIKSTAWAHGFRGEFVADEIHWNTPDVPEPPWPTYSETESAKYYLRSTLTHLGLDVAVTQLLLPNKSRLLSALANLNTVMSGHVSIDMPATIDVDYGPIASCAFRYPNGDRILAVWTDGIARDADPGVPGTITIPGLNAGSVIGIDVLYGFEQELIFETSGGGTVIRDLLIKDYPILIRLSDASFGPGYRETVGDGFRRTGLQGTSSSSVPEDDKEESSEQTSKERD